MRVPYRSQARAHEGPETALQRRRRLHTSSEFCGKCFSSYTL